MTVAVFAPAKINLYLHVTGRRADGYHLLDSLVAFADIGDRVVAEPASTLSLTISGPQSGTLDAQGEENLVLRAARLLSEYAGVRAGAALHLEKHLPVAAGLGGGSSDAAAALRALCRLWKLPTGREALDRLGLALGADIPACLEGRPAWVGGVGERVEPAPALPQAGILLANPRRSLPTPAVFAARQGPFGDAGRFAPIPTSVHSLAQILSSRRNDLTDAATVLVPEIADCWRRSPGFRARSWRG